MSEGGRYTPQELAAALGDLAAPAGIERECGTDVGELLPTDM
ncbi:hypothetical protein ACIA8J_11820 [Streptomyces asoensis]